MLVEQDFSVSNSPEITLNIQSCMKITSCVHYKEVGQQTKQSTLLTELLQSSVESESELQCTLMSALIL